MNHELLNGWLLEEIGAEKTSIMNDCLNGFSFIQVFGHHSNPVWDTLFKGDSGFLNLKCLEPESEQKRTWTVRHFGCISSAMFGYDSNISHRNQVDQSGQKNPYANMPFWSHKFVWNWLGKIFEHLILATKHGSLVIAVRAPELWPHWQKKSAYPMLRWKSSCLALNPNIPTSNQAN